MLTATAESIRARAEAVVASVRTHTIVPADAGAAPDLRVEASEATVGGGAFPTARIPSWAVTLGGDANAIEARLRTGAVPVIARIEAGRVRLDLRSVDPTDDAALASLLRAALA
jgi:L-seryl-tRNA(Ser) seleniumtransferase